MTHDLDGGNGRFRQLLDGVSPAGPRLPLVHTTDAFQLVDIVSDGSLTPQACPVFEGESLTYFFYGRPAFRPNANEDATGLEHYFPVCLIFKPEAPIGIRRVFPFDSGAFQGGFYGSYMHRKMRLGDFAMTADADAPARLVARFYGTNEAYLYSRDPIGEDVPADAMEARSYLGLAGAKGGNAIDSRGSGVELQGEATLALVEALDAVILPISFIDTDTGRSLAKAGVELLGYNTMGRMRPSENIGSITDICATYYLRRRLIGSSTS